MSHFVFAPAGQVRPGRRGWTWALVKRLKGGPKGDTVVCFSAIGNPPIHGAGEGPIGERPGPGEGGEGRPMSIKRILAPVTGDSLDGDVLEAALKVAKTFGAHI